jgi:putative ABC transport system permease protein
MPERPEWPIWKDELRHRLAELKLASTRESAIIEELSQHLDDIYQEHIDDGATPAQAEKLTRDELGESDLLRRELNRIETRIIPEPIILGTNQRSHMIADLWQDLRYAARMLRQKPGFTLVAVLTLALGIGANTAIFSIVNAVLLQPLPFLDTERLLWIGGWARNADKEQGVTPADFLDYREQSRSFAILAASVSDGIPMNLSGDGEPERLKGGMVTFNYLDVFGVKPALGRTFVEEEASPGREQVVVLSHSLWVRRFGADPAIVSKSFTLDGRAVTVIGVMPKQFQFPAGVEIWKPFGFGSSSLGSSGSSSPFRSRELHFLRPIAKLRPDVTIEQAQSEVETIARRLEALYPKTNTNQSLYLMPMQERIVGNIRLTLLVLLGAVGFVMLIACVNVANLLLARAAARSREIAVRAALGAGRGRIVRQLLAESLLLALIGGGAGVLLAIWGVKALVALSSNYLPRADEIGINPIVLGFTLAIALLTGILFGLAPALQSTRSDLTDALKDGGRGAGGGAQRNRVLKFLVAGEVALAVVLLSGAGLLINSFIRLQQVAPGFDETNLLTARIDLPNPYAEPEKKKLFFEQLQQRVAALPGVEAVGLVTELPLARQSADFKFNIEGRQADTPGQEGHADIRNANHDYFRAMRIPLLKGRNFSQAEVQANAKVAVISEVLAERYFPNEDPIGKRLFIGSISKDLCEIIGIVGDVRHRGLDIGLNPAIYFPSLRLGYSNLVIRTTIAPASLAASVRKEVATIDPKQPVANIKAMEQWVSESIEQPRFRTILFGIFSGAALLLSIVGIYGVMSYVVTQRTHELGIRLALGARPGDVMRLVIRQGMIPALAGLAIGLVAALALTRFIKGFLYGIRATDPLTFAAITLTLLVVSLLACYQPARRAAKVDPLVALRGE